MSGQGGEEEGKKALTTEQGWDGLPYPLRVPSKPPPELRVLLTAPHQPGLKTSSLSLLSGVFFSNVSLPVSQFSFQSSLMP